jgi:hypothetical protein
MPCDTVQETVVDLSKSDPGIIEAALRSMGHSVTKSGMYLRFDQGRFNTKTGELTLDGYTDAGEFTKELKRSYSAEVVKSQAKRFGWQLQQKSKYEFVVQKRRI